MDDDLMLVLESQSSETPELEIEAGISIAHVYEGNAVVLAGSDHILMRVLGPRFQGVRRVVLSGEHGHGGEDGRASARQSADFPIYHPDRCLLRSWSLQRLPRSKMRARDRHQIVRIRVRGFRCQSG
ncbi:MAG: hypothetical protein MZV64_60375 [Ignavibacteriales bacterium]|nr:hypothetical protein [Ignavibacteriales bacterium]